MNKRNKQELSCKNECCNDWIFEALLKSKVYCQNQLAQRLLTGKIGKYPNSVFTINSPS